MAEAPSADLRNVISEYLVLLMMICAELVWLALLVRLVFWVR